MRALYLQPSSLFGGAERQCATNVPLLAEHGVEVLPLVGPGRAIMDWLQERGVRDIEFSRDFPGGWVKPRGLARAALPARYVLCGLRIQQAMARIARARSVELVLAALPFSWITATPVARRLGLPIIWRAGGTEISRWERMALAAWASRYPPDLLLCCSQAVADTITPLVPAPAEVVLNGVDTTQFHPRAGDAAALRPPGARLVVGFAARLVPQKRPEDFVQMAARLASRHPDVTFLVAGEGSLRPRFEAMARAAGVGRAIRFLGYVADMRAFYEACDVFVLPSRSEGCPNVVLEAMATRRALVVSDAAGTREVLRDGEEGLVYPIGRVEALGARVDRLLSDDALRRGLAERAYARVVRELGAPAAARRLAELCHVVAASRGRTTVNWGAARAAGSPRAAAGGDGGAPAPIVKPGIGER